jgi:phosphomannomutase
MIDKSVFRNYDIRGEYGKELSAEAVYTIARAYVQFANPKKVIIGSDARVSSPELKEATIRGLVDSGVKVRDVGLVSTDVVYFATWHEKCDGGIMITASHMPKQYNGMKFLRQNDKGILEPIGMGMGMEELEAIANNPKTDLEIKIPGGEVHQNEIWEDYILFVRNFVNIGSIGPLKVVMDAGNGMGGLVAEKLFKGMDIEVVSLFFEPDGTYPNHDPNPFIEENRRDIVAKIKEVGADLGIAWDADCDRCYFLDENGTFINGDLITVLLSIDFLKKKPGSSIVYDLRSSWAVKDWVEKLGGKAIIDKVGHSYIKATMAKHDAVFGGEVSGHYYFADNKYMDNGFIPAVIVLEMMSKENKKISEMINDLGEYHLAGETNFTVADIDTTIKKIEDKYSDGKISKLDGLSVDFEDWHFNVRPSANDPVLRLNLEAKSNALMKEKMDELKTIIESV